MESGRSAARDMLRRVDNGICGVFNKSTLLVVLKVLEELVLLSPLYDESKERKESEAQLLPPTWMRC